MNIQALMKQAQKMQKDMLKEKEDIDSKQFVGKSALITAYVKGNKQVEKIEISGELNEIDDKELLEDMIQVAINDAMNQIDVETEQRMGKFSQGMPGLF